MDASNGSNFDDTMDRLCYKIDTCYPDLPDLIEDDGVVVGMEEDEGGEIEVRKGGEG